jgi:hypothetical protein
MRCAQRALALLMSRITIIVAINARLPRRTRL